MNTRELAEKLLRNHELKATKQRVAVLEAFARARKPLTLRDLARALGQEGAHEVTLYRILDSLVEVRILRELPLGGKTPFYELADLKNDHHHIVCVACGKMRDFIGCPAPELVRRVLRQTKDFVSIEDHSFEFFGTCRACAAC